MSNEKNVITKPVQLMINECKESIINILNNSELHVSVLELIMDQIYNEVKQQASIVYDMENAQYNNILSQQTHNETEKEISETEKD